MQEEDRADNFDMQQPQAWKEWFIEPYIASNFVPDEEPDGTAAIDFLRNRIRSLESERNNYRDMCALKDNELRTCYEQISIQ